MIAVFAYRESGMNVFEKSAAGALGAFPGGAVFLAAVSGGADSTAMLAALAALPEGGLKERHFQLRCLHVEHGIRPGDESRGDAFFVKELSHKLKVPCKIVTIPRGLVVHTALKRGLGIEEAARFYRHRIWNREVQRIKALHPGALRVLVAHTRDDLLETLLMRFLRGSGPAGLAAMPRQRGFIFRPLLEMGRRDVLAYLEEKGISYRKDSSNADLRFLRNRIRHKLVPLLDEYFPSWRASLLSLGETQAFAADFISREAQSRLAWERSAGGLKIPAALFLKAPLILREEAVFQAADRLSRGKKDAPARSPVRFEPRLPRRKSLRRLVSAAAGKVASGDLGPVRIENQEDYLVVKPVLAQEIRGFSLLIKKAGFYTLNGRAVLRAEEFSPEMPAVPGERSFFAVFPLLLRPCKISGKFLAGEQKRLFFDIFKEEDPDRFDEFVTAEDRAGLAAVLCIGSDGVRVVSFRDKAQAVKFTVGTVLGF
ncbi:MAG: tRNA lysidine(34) synthetase TilS [Treponema sp.]|nr:tRNA lysidine(34) synthetase TilS [Treponema sp.]